MSELEAQFVRRGVVLAPGGNPDEAEGILNPAATRSRDGKLLLYPRMVARGNVSRIGIFEATGSPDTPGFKRLGYALEPKESYELRSAAGGYGCEDPRVTFVPALDCYVMAYTAFGPDGPRVAIALSHDGYEWVRLGLADFSAPGLPSGDDKDAAFFPEPVLSPAGVPSLAFYHRPMLHVSALDGRSAVPMILALPPSHRESTRVAYVPLEAALQDRRQLLKVAESIAVLEPTGTWGCIKTGGGTPPVRIEEGWFSLFHAVDALYDAQGVCTGLRYGAGIVIEDLERPDVVRYRSPEPAFEPQTGDERQGVVSDVVFPTGIDPRPDRGPRAYDVYYGMADARIGLVNVDLGASILSADKAKESAA